VGRLGDEGPADESFEIPRHRPPSISRAELNAVRAAVPTRFDGFVRRTRESLLDAQMRLRATIHKLAEWVRGAEITCDDSTRWPLRWPRRQLAIGSASSMRTSCGAPALSLNVFGGWTPLVERSGSRSSAARSPPRRLASTAGWPEPNLGQAGPPESTDRFGRHCRISDFAPGWHERWAATAPGVGSRGITRGRPAAESWRCRT
jgi:hypothetical protein